VDEEVERRGPRRRARQGRGQGRSQGHLASETIVSHLVVATGVLPSRLPWGDEAFVDTAGTIGRPGALLQTTLLSLDEMGKLSLPARLQATVLRSLELIEEHGLDAPGVSFRQIRGKLWEIRVTSGGAARMFYVVVAGPRDPARPEVVPEADLILLHEYLKKSQKAPAKEIALASKRLLEVAG
jgi:phage-related protein